MCSGREIIFRVFEIGICKDHVGRGHLWSFLSPYDLGTQLTQGRSQWGKKNLGCKGKGMTMRERMMGRGGSRRDSLA